VTASELYEVAKFKESKAPDGQIFATLADESKSDMMDRYNVSKLRMSSSLSKSLLYTLSTPAALL
jgi:hypothetical protein